MLNIFLIFLSCSGLASARLPPLAVHVTAAKPAPLRESKKAPAIFREVFPILAASFVTAAAMYPADLLRALHMNQATSGSAIKLTSRQLLGKFVDTHGKMGIFTQGLVPELAKATWSRFLKFSLFPLIHQSVFAVHAGQGSPFMRAIAAAVASVPEAMSIMPLEISKICLQLDTTNKYKNSAVAAVRGAYNDRGLQGLFIGYTGIQLRQMGWTVAYFSSVSFIEEKLVDLSTSVFGEGTADKPGVAGSIKLLSGFLAGVLGCFLNTPFDTVRSSIQKSAFQSNAAVPTFLEAMNGIYATKGLSGLYAGLATKSVHLGGGGALMALLLPFFRNLVHDL